MMCTINKKSYFHKLCENSNFNEDHFLGAEINAFVLYKNAFPIYSMFIFGLNLYNEDYSLLKLP